MDSSASEIVVSASSTLSMAVSVDGTQVLSAISSTKKNRRALADLTNDSPISGLTPPIRKVTDGTDTIFSCNKPSLEGSQAQESPLVGEDLLRCQVKALLQKIDKDSFRPPALRTLSQLNGLMVSPSPCRLVNPTPANTPASLAPTPASTVASLLQKTRFASSPAASMGEVIYEDGPEKLVYSEQKTGDVEMFDEKIQSSTVSEVIDEKPVDATPAKPLIRSLHFESPVANTDCGSGQILETSVGRELEDDEVSNWSTAVNISSPPRATKDEEVVSDASKGANPWTTRDEDAPSDREADEYEDEEYFDYEDEEEQYDEAGGECCDDSFIEGFNRVNMDEEPHKPLPRAEGSHIRFNYNSDDEIEEEIVAAGGDDSEPALKLKGLPTPKGKHLRFNEDDETSSSKS